MRAHHENWTTYSNNMKRQIWTEEEIKILVTHWHCETHEIMFRIYDEEETIIYSFSLPRDETINLIKKVSKSSS